MPEERYVAVILSEVVTFFGGSPRNPVLMYNDDTCDWTLLVES